MIPDDACTSTRVEAHATEDAEIGDVVEVEPGVEAGPVDIEGVRVLHGELAYPEYPGLGPGLVAELGLDLIPDLRQVPVGGQLGGEQGEDLLVGEPQGELGALAVPQPEHLVTDRIPAARLPPDLGRVHGGKVELLPADGVYLLADYPLHLRPHPLTEGEHRVVARGELADVTGSHQQPVADCLGFGWVVAQRGDEGAGPSHGGATLGVGPN